MPTEMLDVFDERGWHRGVKDRDAVHRDGDWHVAFHLWVVRPDGVLLQRRAATKSAWPGRLDATAAGHLIAGEQVRDGLREAEEELGVAYAFGDLVQLGRHRVDDAERPGSRNREIQHVFAVRDDRPLTAWTGWDAEELDGLVLVGHDGFELLTAGHGAPATARAWDGVEVREVEVSAAELVPTPYLAEIAPALRALGCRR